MIRRPQGGAPSRAARRGLALTLALTATLNLAGCASAPSAPPPVAPRVVDIPVAAPCRPQLGAEPDYPDTDAALRAAPDLFARVRLLLAGRLMRIARDQAKSAALAACAGPAGAG